MSKEDEFLWGVQTLLTLYVNYHAHDPAIRTNPTHISAAGHFVTVHMAIAASKRIPADKDVSDAIHDFHFAFVHQPTDESELEVPSWLLGLK